MLATGSPTSCLLHDRRVSFDYRLDDHRVSSSCFRSKRAVMFLNTFKKNENPFLWRDNFSRLTRLPRQTDRWNGGAGDMPVNPFPFLPVPRRTLSIECFSPQRSPSPRRGLVWRPVERLESTSSGSRRPGSYLKSEGFLGHARRQHGDAFGADCCYDLRRSAKRPGADRDRRSSWCLQ